MEVCVDSFESIVNAYEGHANRIELCSSLNEGGLTPTYGLLKKAKEFVSNQKNEFGIFCMVRCRSGDFNYDEAEVDTMIDDINKFVEMEVDGLVFGALTPEGLVDEALMKDFFKIIPTKIKTTFHRAFDVSSDWKTCFDQINSLGFDKLLTSGQQKTAFEGRKLIAQLVEISEQNKTSGKKFVEVMAGSGVNSQNLESILKETKCKEFHASCRVSRDSKMIFRNQNVPMGSANEEFSVKFTDKSKVKELYDIYKRLNSC